MKVVLYQRILKWALLFGSIAQCGCNGKPIFRSERDAAVFVLFDASGSTNSALVRQGYLRDLGTIEQLLIRDGGTLRGDVIGSEALNTSTVPIDVTFPYYNQVLSTDKGHAKQISAASSLLKQQADRMLGGDLSSSQTAVMASLEVAGKILNGDQLKGANRKILVIFSDMLEESPRYNFTRERLTEQRIRAIVEAERSGGRLPNLQGVTVWKAGASAERLDDDRSRALQAFWIQYFKAAGADLEEDHYGPTLLNFPIN